MKRTEITDHGFSFSRFCLFWIFSITDAKGTSIRIGQKRVHERPAATGFLLIFILDHPSIYFIRLFNVKKSWFGPALVLEPPQLDGKASDSTPKDSDNTQYFIIYDPWGVKIFSLKTLFYKRNWSPFFGRFSRHFNIIHTGGY